eukprot:1166401-Amorphochlora_amoeboformis.AAC.1
MAYNHAIFGTQSKISEPNQKLRNPILASGKKAACRGRWAGNQAHSHALSVSIDRLEGNRGYSSAYF